MLQINQITNAPKQRHTLILSDGTSAVMQIEYKPQQVGWFIIELSYLAKGAAAPFVLTNVRIVTGANVLRQFKNLIPFGLAVFVEGNHEPTLQTDFSNGRAKMYILTPGEVQYYEDLLSGQATA